MIYFKKMGDCVNNTKISKILFIISMIIFGTIAIFVKKINLASSEIALYRAIIAVSILGAFLLFNKGNKIKITKKELLLLLFSGTLIGLNWIFLFEAYKYTTVSIATLSYYFAPIIVTIVCPILLKEKMDLKQWICFLMSTIGIILITGFEKNLEKSNHFFGVVLGLSAAILYASVIIINKYIKTVQGIHRSFYQFIATIIILLPYCLFTTGINFYKLSSNEIICVFILGIVHTGVAYCLYFTTLKNLKGNTIALLSYIDPLVAIILSIALLQESINLIQLTGGLLILTFTLINEISFKKIFLKEE